MINIDNTVISPSYLSNDGEITNQSGKGDLIYEDTRIELDNHLLDKRSDFLREILKSRIADYNIYGVYSEVKPQNRSRLRSYKMLFFDALKSKNVKRSSVFENEFEISDSTSLIAGLIRIDTENLDYVLSKLLTSQLQFIYLVKKTKRSFKINRIEFLKSTLASKFPNRKVTIINIKELAKNILGANKGIIKLGVNGGNKETIDLIADQSNDLKDQVITTIENYNRSRYN